MLNMHKHCLPFHMLTEEILVASVNIVKKQSVIDHLLLPLEQVECFDNDFGSQ